MSRLPFLTRAPYMFIVLLVCIELLATDSWGADGAFRAGFAERDISPSIGMEAPGGYGKAYHQAFHDACKVRAAVFDDGNKRVAVVGIDALFIRKQSVARVREQIEAKCGISGAAIMISASHSHSAGPTGYYLPGEMDDADPLIKSLVLDKTVIANAEYLAKVEQSIVDAVCEANEQRLAGKAAAGFAEAERAIFNRRFRMRSGYSMTHPGVGNPEIIEPAGPVDPQVGVLGFWTETGELRGCVVNFACHCTTGPGGISADYVYYIERTIRGLYGDKVVVVFVPGMAGDVTQVNNQTPYQIKQFGEVSARFVGGKAGAAAVNVLLENEQMAGSLVPIDYQQHWLKIPRRVPNPARVAKCIETIKKDPSTVDATEWTFAKEIVVLSERIKREPIVDVEVQAIQVGSAVYLSCPAEYFTQYGLDIKAASKFPHTFPVSLANDCIGYVPTEEALGKRGGGYETRLTSYSNLEPSAGRQIADKLIAMSKTMSPGSVPKAASAPEVKPSPWSYGSLPPELE